MRWSRRSGSIASAHHSADKGHKRHDGVQVQARTARATAAAKLRRREEWRCAGLRSAVAHAAAKRGAARTASRSAAAGQAARRLAPPGGGGLN